MAGGAEERIETSRPLIERWHDSRHVAVPVFVDADDRLARSFSTAHNAANTRSAGGHIGDRWRQEERGGGACEDTAWHRGRPVASTFFTILGGSWIFTGGARAG